MRNIPIRPSSRHYNICFIGKMTMKSQRDKFAGILRYAQDRDITVYQLDATLLPSRLCIQLLERMNLDGIITGTTGTFELLSGLRNFSHCPTVAMDALIPPGKRAKAPAIQVNFDDRKISCDIADFYLRRGFMNFAYIGYCGRRWVPIERKRSAVRRDAFVGRLAEAGRGCAVLETPGQMDRAEREKIAHWLLGLPKPVAVMAYWDNLARDVVDICREIRLRIPDRLAVMGTDNDIVLCETSKPTLTSLKIDFEDGGYKAAEALHALLAKGLQTRHLQLSYGSTAIIERSSTCDSKRSVRLVSNACEYIQRHATSGISARSVSQHLNVSPRILQLRFAEALGHPVVEEIARTKLKAVKRLLETTSLTNSEIAERCGYEPLHLANYFKKKTGMSLGEWRRVNR